MLVTLRKSLGYLMALLGFYLVWTFMMLHPCDPTNREDFNSPHFGTIDFPEVEPAPEGVCVMREGRGPIVVKEGNFSLAELQRSLPMVTSGGRWRPTGCKARSRVAVLAPYRNRNRELGIFLNHIHPFLQRQQLDYHIFLIEQTSDYLFNKGAILNAGFIEASSRWRFDCYVIHDVDVLPEDDRILYKCGDHPRHLAHAASSLSYKLLWNTLFGGVIAFTSSQYRKVNGFSNAFFGWGGEDDDIGQRVLYHGYRILRYPPSIARFKVLDHAEAIRGRHGNDYFETGALRYKLDGLNSLLYNFRDYKEEPLFTHFLIGLNETEIMQPIVKLYRENIILDKKHVMINRHLTYIALIVLLTLSVSAISFRFCVKHNGHLNCYCKTFLSVL